MGVDFSDSDPNRAYLISSTARGNFNGFFTSADAGLTWTAVGATSGGTLQNISGGFAWWFGRVYVDPVNPQHVFVAGVSLAESLNGGATWTTSNTIHADQHGLEFDPFTPGKVHLGNDGGYYSSTQNGAARGAWFKAPRLPVTQFYAMDVSVQDGSRVNAGSQDNGSLKSWATDNTVNGDWFSLLGGDGMMNRIDPTNDRKYYACSQNGGCRGFVGTDTGQTSFSMTFPGADRKNWVTPIEFAADPKLHVRRQSVRLPDEHRAGHRPARVAAAQPGPHRGHRAACTGLRHRHGAGHDDGGSEPRLRRHRQRPDVGQPQRHGRGSGDR